MMRRVANRSGPKGRGVESRHFDRALEALICKASGAFSFYPKLWKKQGKRCKKWGKNLRVHVRNRCAAMAPGWGKLGETFII